MRTKKSITSKHPDIGRKKWSLESRKRFSELMKSTGRKPPSRLGIPNTEEQKAKIRTTWLKKVQLNKGINPNTKIMYGKDNPSWKGGKTQDGRKSRRYEILRKFVFERDNYTCQECKVRGGKLQIDHIRPWALFPDLRFDASNIRTICLDCHKKTETYLNNRMTPEMFNSYPTK